MASFEERIYQLGADALTEQERQVAELRGRGSTLLAAGAVIASLLAEPVFDDVHPLGLAEVASATVGLIGAAGVLAFVGLLLWPRELAVSLNPSATYRALWREGFISQPAVDVLLAEAFAERRSVNAEIVQRLVSCLALTLVALVLEAAGLATSAALAV